MLRLVELQPVVVVDDPGVGAVARACLRVLVAHEQDAVGLGHGQGPQQHVVHDREQRGVGADAEGQGQGHGEAEGLVAGQEPQPHPEVAIEPVQDASFRPVFRTA